MISACRKPVLILEGAGDKDAVPELIRKLAHQHGIFDLSIVPHPIIHQNIPKLRAGEELERFVQYGLMRDGDSLLLLLDCDDLCAKDEVHAFAERVRKQNPIKKVGVAFFNSEYESLFITCLDLIAERYPDYGWNLEGWNADEAHEEIVGAKGYISRHMKHARAYKATRDQVKVTSALDFDRLREKSRSFRHLESTLLWLTGRTNDDSLVYPFPLR